jgi:hypothetical protein
MEVYMAEELEKEEKEEAQKEKPVRIDRCINLAPRGARELVRPPALVPSSARLSLPGEASCKPTFDPE